MVAILDWKVDENADPLADVAFFMMMFLKPGDYGYRYKQLPKLLLGGWTCIIKIAKLIINEIHNKCLQSMIQSGLLDPLSDNIGW